ncbi:hypothetical protein BU23DRAFT_599174 [Bimuria novae-zelandiae CBS 107.79]|uniref:Uncharacterized protein n=1 Tax=Bimuria novae-zelandiae CBS 107.79 TaxID=1447943 RepID=A0A6A5VIM8_9PLEO|nr:hypothetical protein BU23DRAFT_599174 [Bimuria novae-zelandiae CBS 107.79]
MFDLCSERLLEGEERFAPRDGHRFAEILVCDDDPTPDDSMPVFRSGDLQEKEIAGWLHAERSASVPVRSKLRILLSPKPSGKPSNGKLPLAKQTYLALSRAWRIPKAFIRAVAQKLPIVTRCSVAPIYSPFITSPSPTIPNSVPKDEELDSSPDHSTISDRAKLLLVRGDVDWTWDYTLIQIEDPVTQIVHAFIVGLTATEIDLLLSYLPHVSSSCSVPTHPALLPLILLDLATDETASLLKLRIKLMSQIQQRTGMDRFNSLKSAIVAGEREPRKSLAEERKELDLDAVMLRLTCLSDWVAAQRGFISIQERVSNVVAGMLADEPDDTMLDMFRERLAFVRESLRAAEEKCVYLERSISAQVQTVYSLIAQKDNRLNHSATRASCQIASDSRRIALLTRRDSTDMRIIAAVTLIFLPGTFVATVFSTGLFDWGHGDPTAAGSDDDDGSGRMISKYIWVYFMLTGALTAVVLVAWALFSWIQNRKMVRKFGLNLDEGEGSDWDDWNEKNERRRDTQMTLVSDTTAHAGWRRLLFRVLKLSWRRKVADEEDTKLA